MTWSVTHSCGHRSAYDFDATRAEALLMGENLARRLCPECAINGTVALKHMSDQVSVAVRRAVGELTSRGLPDASVQAAVTGELATVLNEELIFDGRRAG